MRDSQDLSFPSAVRVRSRADFLNIQRFGRKIRGRCFTLLAIQNDLPFSRFGITVSKKIGNAVERNRIKRKIREIQRLTRSEIPPGYDIVVIARKESTGTSFMELKNEYGKLVRLADLAKWGSQS